MTKGLGADIGAAPPGEDEDEDEAVAAAAASHRSWNAACAAAAGGESRQVAGGLITHAPDDKRGGQMQVLFVDRAAEAAATVLEWMASVPPLRTVGWWATTTQDNVSVGSLLLSRGFQWGWRPHWMRLDLSRARRAIPLPAGVRLVRLPEDEDALPPQVGEFAAEHRGLTHLDPPATTIFAACDAQAVVGSITLHVHRPAPGATPVGGMYDCWVAETQRRRGIGSALTLAAAERAEALGCAIAVLNATAMGALMYRTAGFRSAGWGQTWWMVDRQLRGSRPDAAIGRLVEAIGEGDVQRLDAALAGLRARDGGFDLEVELPCSETPLGVAVRLQQHDTARRLVEHGAVLDVISAWDLGWRDAAAELLRDHPELANHRRGDGGLTPLHVAVARDDEALARLVLAAKPDLALRDLEYHSTALGWAEHFGRARLTELLQLQGRDRAADAETP